jgi:hypothetical protein
VRPKLDPPNYSIQRRLGGSARARLGPIERAAAASALADAVETVTPFIQSELRELDSLSRARPFNAPTALFARANRIGDLAGTCGMPALGRAAKTMCTLLEGLADGEQIDANLVTSIAVTMIHAAKPNAEADPALLEELLGACEEAVAHARLPES